MCAFRIVAEVTQSDNLGVEIPIILLAKLGIFKSLFSPINHCKHMKNGTIHKNWLNNTLRWGWTDSCLSLRRTVRLCWQALYIPKICWLKLRWSSNVIPRDIKCCTLSTISPLISILGWICVLEEPKNCSIVMLRCKQLSSHHVPKYVMEHW